VRKRWGQSRASRTMTRRTVAALVAGVVVVSGCSLSNGQSDQAQGQFLLRSSFRADRILVGDDRVLRSEVTPSELSAACQSLSDAANDLTFGTDVIMVDSPELLRSAELLDGDFADVPSAFEFEELTLTGGLSAKAALTRIRESDGDEAAEVAARYAMARSEPPSASAERGYVVYLAQRTTTQMDVVRRSVEPVSMSSSVDGWGRVGLRRFDGTDIGIEPKWCADQ